MRLIWTTTQLEQCQQFAAILYSKNIAYTLEGKANKDWGSEEYGDKTCHLWIHDEDQVEQAEALLRDFQKNPKDAQFELPAPEEIRTDLLQLLHSPSKRFLEKKLHTPIRPRIAAQTKKPPTFKLSNFLILLCSVLLLLEMWRPQPQEAIPKPVQKMMITTSALNKALLYDYPAYYELLDKIVSLYGYDALLKPDELPPPGKFLYQQHLKTKDWRGILPPMTSWIKDYRLGEKTQYNLQDNPPLFEKISHGEVWRLITPILLHGDILHLFFNMVWILLVGVQLEARIGLGKYSAFIAITACLSNTMQYLMSGPAFLGFSGVICAMVFFIRARQNIAPWEGYQMSRSTYHFIIFFITTLAGLSAVTFFSEAFFDASFPVQIANTAHIAGACSGWLLGRTKFFCWTDQ